MCNPGPQTSQPISHLLLQPATDFCPAVTHPGAFRDQPARPPPPSHQVPFRLPLREHFPQDNPTLPERTQHPWVPSTLALHCTCGSRGHGSAHSSAWRPQTLARVFDKQNHFLKTAPSPQKGGGQSLCSRLTVCLSPWSGEDRAHCSNRFTFWGVCCCCLFVFYPLKQKRDWLLQTRVTVNSSATGAGTSSQPRGWGRTGKLGSKLSTFRSCCSANEGGPLSKRGAPAGNGVTSPPRGSGGRPSGLQGRKDGGRSAPKARRGGRRPSQQ